MPSHSNVEENKTLSVFVAARNHVNRMCLAADIPLIESGTAGYLGQVTVIKKVEHAHLCYITCCNIRYIPVQRKVEGQRLFHLSLCISVSLFIPSCPLSPLSPGNDRVLRVPT